MPRFARYVLVLIGAACVVFLAVVAVTAAVYSPTYVYRYLTLMDAGVGDHARFPARAVEAAVEPHRFVETEAGAEGSVVSALEETRAVGGDIDGFLTDTQTQALIVIRDGEVLFERYVGEFKRESIATSFSTAKSFLSVLVGIAIDEGAIGGIDDPITEYLPELLERDERFGDITIRHLLNMSSGIHYVETGLPNGDDALTYYFDDLEELALEGTTIDGPPGQEWLYNNYHPLLLGVILERTTGMPVADYLEAKIWQPMGAEFDGSWSLDSEDGLREARERHQCASDRLREAWAALSQRRRGTGRFSRRAAEWVDLSTQPPDGGDQSTYYPATFDRPFGSVSHHMFWWHVERPDGSSAFSAVGNHGQFIFVSPSERIVIVRNGETYGIGLMAWLELFAEASDSLRP